MNYLLNELLRFEDPFFGLTTIKNESKYLLTDIKETEKDYIIEIEVSGIKKENIKLSLEDKNLTVSVEKKVNKDENVTYLHSERVNGTFTRSFYVGDETIEDIKANVEDGILSIVISKENFNKKEQAKYIEIN